ncbi:phosphohistidine phosphatase SixA [Halomonas sp. HP20-15]|uniref:phosphohistidine phosphatase SixA n=1 Tax=Halomonas sp. HP20-15 TaxID=3085901 RepID=UPI002981668E|nr:phosphohistidine phosphatase SixA [Halomonas sp. HP20-15]MDW5377555.1 phosphohistidine phosphatase SixA [Halomonas sp. HP20-15]
MRQSLWIMRHGQAAAGRPDEGRELTAQGREEVALMADWLARSLTPSQAVELRIAASPYLRAQQTASIVADRLDKRVETLSSITPDDSVEAVIDWLQASRAAWLLVSHMPLVGSLTGRLVDRDPRSQLPMPTAAIAALEADVWAAGCAELCTFRHPADFAGQ